ncbi:hypothetical protein K0M31_000385 [Melipona bicolor]|uniref:Uncharacterized protein n=1 Tax=Melipona bicolor TaxID=60889 RepID=A0AA40GDG7_9HYME|nr:hypothetical protein K0M31_000385 [Melipona bicolor]
MNKNISRAVTNIPKSDRDSQPRRKARRNDRAPELRSRRRGKERRRTEEGEKKRNGPACVKAAACIGEIEVRQ